MQASLIAKRIGILEDEDDDEHEDDSSNSEFSFNLNGCGPKRAYLLAPSALFRF